MRYLRTLFILFTAMLVMGAAEPLRSPGFAPDPTAKTLSELRAAERRKIPLDVYLKTSNHYQAGDSVEVTVTVTNLFRKPLLMNSRMLVNHPLLQGELHFDIKDESGNPVNLETPVTPLTVKDEDLVILDKGESIQRTVDLADLFGMSRKGSYVIQACYHNEMDGMTEGERTWKGRVWSEPVHIELQ